MPGGLAAVSKVLGTIGKIAGIIALIPSPIQPIAAAVAAVATVGAQVLAKPPRAQGSINQRTIGANQPMPYLMGEAYTGGAQVHDAGWGGEVSDVTNPYRFIAAVASCCGPVDGLRGVYADYGPVGFSGTAATGYYAGFLYRDYQLGERPETDALAPHWTGCPDWTAAHKLSGFAAIGFSLKFDKKGKRFGGGVPALGAVWGGVSVYDPRLDSTFPGGSGSQRIGDESTWAYSRNPALHAATYAYGRHVNGKHVFGPDLGGGAVDLSATAAWANVCDANGWLVNGTIYEPGDSWNNLKKICEAGSARPSFRGGVLTFAYDAPKVSLDTIDLDDLADGEISAGCLPWKDRINQVVPKFRSPAHQWGYPAADAVIDVAAVAEDGEDKTIERQWDLVTDKDQVTQLAAYVLANARERGPIALTCKPRMMTYRPGQALTLSSQLIAMLGLTSMLGPTPGKVTIAQASKDVATATVTFTLVGETDSKHAVALGQVGTVPPVAPVPSASDLDDVAVAATAPLRASLRTRTRTVAFPLSGDEDQIDVAAFDAVLEDGSDVSFAAGLILGLASGVRYCVFRALAGGDYFAVAEPALDAMADPTSIFIDRQSTSSGGTFPTTPVPPDGWGGDGPQGQVP